LPTSAECRPGDRFAPAERTLGDHAANDAVCPFSVI
jgi:hypothetical protein